jgi:hypothetical protein
MRANIDWFEDRGIPGTAYRIQSTGNVWSTESEQWLKPQDNKGYLEVDLKYEGYRVKAKIHRIVAMAFLPHPDPTKDEVNHIDGDRTNNDISNLEWVNHSENIQHRNEVLQSDPGGKTKKPIALMINPIITHICKSHVEAIEYLGCNPAQFYKALSTDHKIHGIVLAEIQNPEVLNDVRNQNKSEHGQGSSDQEQVGGEKGSSSGETLSEATVSPESQRVLDKWKGRQAAGRETARRYVRNDLSGSLVNPFTRDPGLEEEIKSQVQRQD